MRLSLLFVLMSAALHGVAMPKSCKPLAVTSNIEIKKETPLVVFHSLTNVPVYLSYANHRGTASAGYSSEIKPLSYSLAYVAKDFDMSFHCVESGYGYAQRVECKQVMEVCYFDKKPKGVAQDSAFWLLENIPLSVLEEKLAGFNQNNPASLKNK